MSIYSAVKDRLPRETPSASRREATLVMIENGAPERHDPVLGVRYLCDFRYEEEAGSRKIAYALLAAADPSSFFAQQAAHHPATVTPPVSAPRRSQRGLTQAQVVYRDEDVVVFTAERPYAPERELARARQFIGSRQGAGSPQENVHPGWFHYGTLLVLPRTDDVFGEVLEHLVEAAQAGFLAAGGNGVGFGTSCMFFDERDISEESRAVIARANIEHEEDMQALRPVAEVVQAKYGYYALGSPQRGEDGVPRYWLNGHSVLLPSGRRTQPYGWYTVEELRAEKYIQDAEAKLDKSAAAG